jgi:hypothetical protein
VVGFKNKSSSRPIDKAYIEQKKGFSYVPAKK